MVYKWSEMTPLERDTLVEECLMRIRNVNPYNDTIPCYTTDIRAAWEVVQAMINNEWYPEIEYIKDLGKWRAWFSKNEINFVYAYADTILEAICQASLKAVGVEVE